MTRSALAASLASLSLAASASPAAGSVTIGQLYPASSPPGTCITAATDIAQLTVTSGNTYVVPGAGTITSWSHNASFGAGQTLTVKIFRKVADPATYMVVGHAGPQPLTPGGTAGNTFPANIPVKAGDVLGLNIASPSTTACAFSASGDSFRVSSGNLADGASGDFTLSNPDFRLNVSAVFVPSNVFTLRKTAINKKKGAATLTATVPNPGELTASGNGVKAASARAVTSKSVPAGPVQLLIKAKGKKKRKLNETGKVKLNVAVTYTPTNGDPSTQSLNVKLKKL